MNDIVATLRIEARASYPEGKYLTEIMKQAADEIERLRALYAPWREMEEGCASLPPWRRAYYEFMAEMRDKERERIRAEVLKETGLT